MTSYQFFKDGDHIIGNLLLASVLLTALVWNFTFGFYFDLFVVMGMAFCIGVPNFIQIGQCTTEIFAQRLADFLVIYVINVKNLSVYNTV